MVCKKCLGGKCFHILYGHLFSYYNDTHALSLCVNIIWGQLDNYITDNSSVMLLAKSNN